METLKELFFESPLYVYITLALVELAVAAVWFERRSPKVARWMVVPVLLAGAVFAVERMVVTDREQIVSITEQIARDMEAGDVDAAMTHVDDDFIADFVPLGNVIGKDAAKRAAAAVGKLTLAQHKPSKITLSDYKVDFKGNSAVMTVRSVMWFTTGEAKDFTTSLRWTLHWVKKGDEWLINEAEYKQGL
ncbi:MAG: nuclear transport factor 2 family protein [Planctomycetaceae bacterium]|nr:MAG: nuclear transport factor 2 family protein [Planctomycetaceae bacterium]